MLLPLTGIRDSGFGTRTRRLTDAPIAVRTASEDDADAIHELIDEHLTEGHLLPRELGEILVPAPNWLPSATPSPKCGRWWLPARREVVASGGRSSTN
jgi:hypothetical protein